MAYKNIGDWTDADYAAFREKAKESNRWFGSGAVGRATSAPQSKVYYPTPDYDFDKLFFTDEGKQPARETVNGSPYPGVAGPQDDTEWLMGWDYEHPPVNDEGVAIDPYGDPLPDGAKGFDPFGNVYWGDTVTDYFRGVAYRLTKGGDTGFSLSDLNFGKPKEETGLFTPAEALLNVFRAKGEEESTDAKQQLAASFKASAADIFKLIDYGLTDYTNQDGEITIFQKAGRLLGETIGVVLEGFSVPAEKVEQYAGAAALARQELAEQYGVQSRVEYPDWTPDWVKGLSEMAFQLSPVSVYKVAKAGATWDEFTDKYQQNLEAGRMAYTALYDETAKTEFIQRYKEGQNPVLLAMELQNPGAELLGQLVLDPLNFVGLFTKGIQAERRVGTAIEDLTKIADPRVAEVLEAAIKLDRAGVTDDFVDMAKYGVESNKAAAARLNIKAYDYGLMATTTAGKRNWAANRAGNFLGLMAGSVKGDPDRFMDIVGGMIKLASTDSADDYAEGLLKLSRYDAAQLFLGQTGQDTGLMLRAALTDANGVVDTEKFLNGLEAAGKKDGIYGVLGFLDSKVTKAVDNQFPTVLERVAKGEDMGRWTTSLAKFDALAKNKVYARVNQFFANVYMGMSPGFAFRNALSNMTHVLVDQGPGAYFSLDAVKRNGTGFLKIDYIADELALVSGGDFAVVREATQGIGTAAASEGVGITSPGKYKGPIAAGKEAGAGKWFLGVSNEYEKGAGLRIMNKSYKETMERMMRGGRGFADESGLLAKGMSSEDYTSILQKITSNYYDVDAGIEKYIETVATGWERNVDTFGWLSRDDAVRLDAYNLKRGFEEAVSGSASYDEAVEKIDKMFDNLIKTSEDYVKKEIPGVPLESEFFEDMLLFNDGFADGGYVDGMLAIQQNRFAYTTQTKEAYREVTNTIRNGVESMYRNGMIDDAQYAAYQQVYAKYAETINGQLWSKIGGESKELRTKINNWKNVLNSRNLNDTLKAKGWGYGDLWKQIGITGDPPKNLTLKELKDHMWAWYYGETRTTWSGAINTVAVNTESFVKDVDGLFPDMNFTKLEGLTTAEDALSSANIFNQTEWTDAGITYLGTALKKAINNDDGAQAARVIANQFGVGSITRKGNPYDNHIINLINKYGDMGITKLNEISTERLEEVIEAFNRQRDFNKWPRLNIEIDPTKIPEKVVFPAWDGNSTLTASRAIQQQKRGLLAFREDLKLRMNDVWGGVRPINPLSPELKTELAKWAKTTRGNVTVARGISGRVATAARNFALHDYANKRNLDLALSYVYPYSFWYSRTYKNWIPRIVTSPGVVAAYAKYKETLAEIHAGAPEWWKYNINTNELLGIDMENPLYFNLEQTLNPLNGLTGVDFNDPDKRVDTITKLMDDMGKFGPSIWTPWSVLVAYSLYNRGEKDAASRWAGQLFTQSRPIRSIGSALGIDALANYQDPFTVLFADGLDPYERPRVARALGALVYEGTITQEQAIDASRTQNGEIWEQAIARALSDRTGSNLSSFFLGAGFKSRTQSDIAIDRFYQEYRNLWVAERNMTPEEFRLAMDAIHERYPFMDTVLLARQSGPEQDKGLAYNVLGRIPPGQMSDIAQAIGVDERLLSSFYDSKGHLEDWAETDRQRFMAAIVDLSLLLELPSGANRQEWSFARTQYSAMQSEAELIFGKENLQLLDIYFARKAVDSELGNAFIEQNPVIGEILDWQTGIKYNDPILFKYYGGIDLAERYWKGQMYQEIEQEIGDMSPKWDEYFRLKDVAEESGSKEDKAAVGAYYKAHPEFDRYFEIKEKWEKIIEQKMTVIGSKIQDVSPALRPDFEAAMASYSQQDYIEQYAPDVLPIPTKEEWKQLFTTTQWNLIEDQIIRDENMPSWLEGDIEQIAEANGMTVERLLTLIRQSLMTR